MIEKYYPDLYCNSIRDINLNMLKDKGIKGLILDIDNTLVPNHTLDADENAISWIRGVKNTGFKVCIVSNATKKRVLRFNKDIAVKAIHRAFKPSGKAFLKAADELGLEPEEIAVVGDQIFTDIHGGNKVNMFTILVKPIDKKEFIFVRLKRNPERIILSSFNKEFENRIKKRTEWKKNRLQIEKSKFKQ